MDRIRSGLLHLLIGLAPIVLIIIFESSRSYTPIDLPAPIKPGKVSAAFNLNYPGTYTIQYRVKRSIPYQELTCLLSVEEIDPLKCRVPEMPVSTSWNLYNGGKLVARGSSQQWTMEESSAADLSASIGNFNVGTYQSSQYFLTVILNSDLSRLSLLKPRLVVEIHPASAERFLIPELAAFSVGVILAIIGLWKCLAGAIASVRDHIEN